MVERVQQVGLSQESGEFNFHEDWTHLAPSINEILKEDHLKVAIESLDIDENTVPLALPENYFEDQTNSLWTLPEEDPVPICENISPVRKDSSIDQDGDTDELNLSYNVISCSQVLLDAQEDAEIHVMAADLASRNDDSISTAFETQDREFKANSLQINCAESSPINSIETQYNNLSNTLSQNSFAERLNTDELKERELCCDPDHRSISIAFETKDQEFKADSLLINCAERSLINSSECDKKQYHNLSNTLSQNSNAEKSNNEKANERELSCSSGQSEIIERQMKNVGNSSDVCSAEMLSILVTKPNATEEHTHSEAPVKYKPQFGNKKRKLLLSEETGEKQSTVESATGSILAIEMCSVKESSAENDSTTIADETAGAEDDKASQTSTKSISGTTAEAATSDRSNKDAASTNHPKSTTGRNELSPIDKTVKFKNKAVKSRGKPSTVGSDTINESVLTTSKSSKSTSESVSRKGKQSTTSHSKLGKGKAKASEANQNSTVATNSSIENVQMITDIKHFLEHQESLASARNLLRYEKQKCESKSTKMSVSKAGLDESFEDTTQNTYEEKVTTLDGEVSLLETMIEQVKSLTEGEEDHDKCLSLFVNIQEQVSASLLLKYPVVVAVLEPMQRYEIDERIKQEAEEIYKQLDSMYIKQNMEDFVFNFNKILRLHNRHLAKSERLAQKILKRVLPESETNTELTFDVEMWSNLAKERDSVWDRFIQEFQEADKATVSQAGSGSNSQTLIIKEDIEELNSHLTSAVLNTITQEQQDPRKLPQLSSSRTGRKASHSSSKSHVKREEIIVKPEHGVNNDDNLKSASNKLFVRIKEEIVLNSEALKTNQQMQRRQPTRLCKIQNIKAELSSCDEPIIRVKQEINSGTEIVNIKKEKQQKQSKKSSKCITIKVEELFGHDQIIRIKKEITSDTDIPHTSGIFSRIQPRREGKPSKEKLECRMDFTKRKRCADKEAVQMSKKARVSSD